MAVYNFFSGVRSHAASQGVSGSRYQSIFDLTNPHHGHPRMHVKFFFFFFFIFFNSTLHNLNFNFPRLLSVPCELNPNCDQICRKTVLADYRFQMPCVFSEVLIHLLEATELSSAKRRALIVEILIGPWLHLNLVFQALRPIYVWHIELQMKRLNYQ